MMADIKAPRRPTQTWSITKPAVTGHKGIVAAQHHEAARAGAAVLSRGGNAMDAAVTTALVLSVVEPWLSGIGGGGFLLHASASGTIEALDFNLVAPVAADPGDYPVTGGTDGEWFNWPAVKDNRNLIGGPAICVPGAVAGLAEALARHGTLSWAEAIAPAAEIAERGMLVDWFAELAFAVDQANIATNPEAAALFLDRTGLRPAGGGAGVTTPAHYLPMPQKARTLRRLASAGPRDFYEGEIAAQLVADLVAAGSRISAEDLATYRPQWLPPATMTYRDRTIATIPGLSGGPSLFEALEDLVPQNLAEMGEAAVAAAYANAIEDAYETRLTTMGHAAATSDCTSHLSVVDAHGNMVALTNTLLSRFGAKVVLPQSGILMNNGMMWFDPRAGQPNAIKAGAKPLANMCPVITLREGRPEIAIGAAGGRQIFPAILQLLSFIIDRGDTVEAAVHRPRLDASTPTVLVNRRAAPDVATAISEKHPVQLTEDTVYPVQFAVPSVVQAGAAGAPSTGATHPVSPWASAIAAS